MIDEKEIHEIVRKARHATNPGVDGLLAQTGGWSNTPRSGRAYRGVVVHDDAGAWAVCRGTQRPAYSRLLDAASCLRFAEGVSRGVAILDPPNDHHAAVVPQDPVRLRRAAWHGLGILWCANLAHDEGPWDLGSEFPPLDLDALLPDIEGKLRAAANGWGRLVRKETSKGVRNDSRQAEKPIQQVIGGVLGDEWNEMGKAVETFWRRGATDGAWSRKTGNPTRIALEVKVDEDPEAPFGQIIDDLGTFDAVVCVRLLVREEVRAKLHGVQNIGRARAMLVDNLPVKMIELRFCADCRALLPSAADPAERLMCDDCALKALPVVVEYRPNRASASRQRGRVVSGKGRRRSFPMPQGRRLGRHACFGPALAPSPCLSGCSRNFGRAGG